MEARRLAVLLVLASGCLQPRDGILDDIVLDPKHNRGPRVAETVVVSTARPSRKHRVVALLAVEDVRGMNSSSAMDPSEQVAILQRRAAKLGCDEVVVRPADIVWCRRRSLCVDVMGHRGECLIWDEGSGP